MKIPVGDILEWLGAAALVCASAIWSGLVVALAVSGVALLYFAQVFATDTLTIGTTKENPNPDHQQDPLSTDSPERFTPLRVCTTPEEARQAALSSVSVTCLDCNQTFVENDLPEHRCLDPKTRHDNGPMKKARVEGARRELAALRNYPAPPCANCSARCRRGGPHMLGRPRAPSARTRRRRMAAPRCSGACS